MKNIVKKSALALSVLALSLGSVAPAMASSMPKAEADRSSIVIGLGPSLAFDANIAPHLLLGGSIGLPFLTGQGDAFAAVQAHFRDFRSLQMDVVQRHGDQVLITSRTRVNASGATRTDVGESLSIVVDPARGRMLTLLHEERRAIAAAIPAHAAATGKDIAWLDELRRYTGTYRADEGQRLVATLEDAELAWTLSGSTLPARPVGDHGFVLTTPGGEMYARFLVKADGPAWAVALGSRIIPRLAGEAAP